MFSSYTHLVPSLNKHKVKWGNTALLLGNKKYTYFMPFSNSNLHFFPGKSSVKRPTVTFSFVYWYYDYTSGCCCSARCDLHWRLASVFLSSLVTDHYCHWFSHLNPLVIKVDPLWLVTELFLALICRTWVIVLYHTHTVHMFVYTVYISSIHTLFFPLCLHFDYYGIPVVVTALDSCIRCCTIVSKRHVV